MRILFVLRTAGYFPYHQTTIDHLLQRGHHVTLLFEPAVNASGPADDHGFQEWLTRVPRTSLVVGQAVRRQDVWRRLLFIVREVRSYASYCRRGTDVTFYRERWRHSPVFRKDSRLWSHRRPHD